MAGRESPPSLKDLQARLEAARSRQQKKGGAGGPGQPALSGSGLGLAFRIAVDLLAGLAIGVGLGLVLDDWLNTTPWMLVVFLFLGAAAGMLNVYRAATGRGYAVGYRKAPDGGADEGETGPADAGETATGARDDGAADEDRGGEG